MLFNSTKLARLNDLELEVYRLVQDLQEAVLTMKIRELADMAHVSVTVIWNFCKKLDCDGWTEFKFKYKEWLATAKTAPENIIKSPNEYVGLAEEELDLLKADIKKAAIMIQEAARVIFIGFTSSGVLAKYGSIYLGMMGKNCQYIDIAGLPIYPEDYEDTLIIALSVSGETLMLTDRLVRYQELGAKIITVTNGSDNTHSKLAHLSLSYNVPIEEVTVLGPNKIPIRINTTSQMPVIYIIETMAKQWGEMKSQQLTTEIEANAVL